MPTYNYSEVDRFKRGIAFWGAIICAIPNIVLTTIFFLIAIGTLSYFFGEEWGFLIALGVAAFLGIAFIAGETVTHIEAKQKGEAGFWFVMVLLILAAINVGAGMSRNADYIRVNKNKAIMEAANDPRYKEAQADKESARIMDNNKWEKDDDEALAKSQGADERMDKIVKQHIELSHVGAVNTKFSLLIALSFVAVNLIFGLLVRACITSKEELETIRAENQKKRQEKERLKLEKQSQRKQSSPTPPRNLEPVAVNMIVKKKPISDLNKLKSDSQKKRIETVKMILEKYPDLPQSEQAKKANMSINTFKKYKRQIDSVS